MGFSPAEMKEMLLTYSRVFQHKQREGKSSSLYILKGMPPETVGSIWYRICPQFLKQASGCFQQHYFIC
jgi:hypothetical protein